ncbi:jg22856, partial [Pararge aegeria aegeria]
GRKNPRKRLIAFHNLGCTSDSAVGGRVVYAVLADGASIIKCNTCNIVINEVMCFIRDKLDVMKYYGYFAKEEIFRAKTLLQQAVPSTKRMILHHYT